MQLVLQAASQKSDSPYILVQIDCDNDRVVKHGNAAARLLPDKQPHANILRCFKQQIISNPFESEYHWVESHTDNHKSEDKRTLQEKGNTCMQMFWQTRR